MTEHLALVTSLALHGTHGTHASLRKKVPAGHGVQRRSLLTVHSAVVNMPLGAEHTSQAKHACWPGWSLKPMPS